MSNVPFGAIPPVHFNQVRIARMPPNNADGDTMERLFQALFYRIAFLYARTIPQHIRRLGETAILVLVNLFVIRCENLFIIDSMNLFRPSFVSPY